MQVIVTSNAAQIMEDIERGKQKAHKKMASWVGKLTNYAEKKMKYHAPSTTKRSTGKLKRAITSELHLSKSQMYGIAYIPEEIKYQFVLERGRKAGETIQGSPRLAFKTWTWKKGSRNSSILMLAHGDKFIFASVEVGAFKGKHFVEKSYNEVLNFYQKNEDKIITELGTSLNIGSQL